MGLRRHRVLYWREALATGSWSCPTRPSSGLWEHQVEHFRAAYQVLAVDLPGYGRLDRLEAETTQELSVRWLERFVADRDLAAVVLVGNCIGSFTALQDAAGRPEAVSALLLQRRRRTAPPSLLG